MSDAWLPPLIKMSDADVSGNWTAFLTKVYGQFEKDFVRSKPVFLQKRMGLKRHPEYDNKSATFWHFISEGTDEAERTPDLRRCERIAWPRAIIEAIQTDQILWWKEKRGASERYILALPDFSYVVVVDDRGEYVLPWTAYCVEYDHQRRKLSKKHQQYWSDQKS